MGLQEGSRKVRRLAVQILCVSLCFTASGLFGAHLVRAEEPRPEPTVLERLERLEENAKASTFWQQLRLKFSGLIDVAYTQNFHNPSSDLNQLRTFDTNANAFMPHLFQFMVERPADAGGSALDRAGFRARLNFGSDARVSRARTNYQTGTSNDEFDLQEVYGQYILPIGNGLDIKVGKMNTLIGYEVINSSDNVNFSRSFTFGLGQAFTTTGVRLSYQFNPIVLASVGIVNGWDNVDDNNRGKTIEWLLALSLTNKVSLSFYGSYGPEQANRMFGDPTDGGAIPGNSSATQLATGAVLTIKVTDKDLLVVEPFYANEADGSTISSAHNARWNSVVGRWIHDFTDQWSLRGRGEIFEDAGGARTCLGTFNSRGGSNTCFGATNTTPAPAVAQTLWETTWTLQFRPIPSFISRLEFRYDKSDHNVFQHGTAASNNQETLSLELMYVF